MHTNLLRLNLKLFKNILKPFTTSIMAKSKFEYVRNFEREEVCLPNTWIVVRIDGKNFSKFSNAHGFEKPNDIRALELMNQAANVVMQEFNELILAFGQSDEYSFVFRKDAKVYNRRASKLSSMVNSLFSSAYIFHWSDFFPSTKPTYPPSFDARVVLYPSEKNIRDYLSWRQADVHINNLYNTCFWNLVQKKNMTTKEAQETLRGTDSSDKNEILFKDFGINYNKEKQMFRKGSTLIRKTHYNADGTFEVKIVKFFDDIIGETFWQENPELLTEKLSTTQQNKQKKLMAIQNKNSEIIENKAKLLTL